MCSCSYISLVFPPVSACASCRYSLRPSRALEAPVQLGEGGGGRRHSPEGRSSDWRLFVRRQLQAATKAREAMRAAMRQHQWHGSHILRLAKIKCLYFLHVH